MTAVSPQQRPQGEEDGEGATLTILEHLQEARKRMMICAAAMVPALVIGAFLANPVLRWLKVPAERRVEDFDLIFIQPLEFWMTFFRVMLLIAFALIMPILVWQFLAFVGPGLTRKEKKWAYPIVLGAGAMFIAGNAFAYYVGLPPALNFLLDGRGVAEAQITVRSYVDFVTRFMFVAGLVFETPLIVMALAKIGLVNSKKLLGWWRFAVLGSFVVAAIITPSIDPITQTFFALPLILFYFVGIALAKLVEKTPIIPRY